MQTTFPQNLLFPQPSCSHTAPQNNIQNDLHQKPRVVQKKFAHIHTPTHSAHKTSPSVFSIFRKLKSYTHHTTKPIPTQTSPNIPSGPVLSSSPWDAMSKRFGSEPPLRPDSDLGRISDDSSDEESLQADVKQKDEKK